MTAQILTSPSLFINKVAPTFSYRGNTSSGSNLTSYTFAAFDIGTAASDRVVAVCIGSEGNASTDVNITGVTIGGVTATEIVRASDTGGSPIVAAIFAAVVPTGATGDIVVTYQTAPSNCCIEVYAIYDTTIPAAATGHDQTSGSTTATARSVTLARDAGSVAIGTTTHNGNIRLTYAELTEDFDAAPTGGNSGMGSGSATEATGRGSVVHTSTPASATQQAFAVAVFA